MKKFSLETKVVFSVVLLVLFIYIIERYQITSNITSQFIKSEKARNDLLVNTISPIISINLSLGLLDANDEYLDEIIKQNPDIEILKITDLSNNIIYYYQQHTKIKKSADNYLNHDIIDNVTNNTLAKLELYISQDRYAKLLEDNNTTTIEIFFITFIILIIFLLLLKKEFLSLRELSNNIQNYDPQKNNFPLNKSDNGDEVGVIHNAIIDMVERIHSYTQLIEKSQQEKEETNLLLAQQSKMACLGEMLSSITHQWKQPLSVISTVNVKLKVGSDLNLITQDKINKDTQAIENQLNFMTQTLKDFSNFFMPDKELVKFSPKEAIESIMTLFGSDYDSNNIKVTINQKTSDETATILSYNNEFRQVILNLLTNAKDAIVEQNSSDRRIDILITSDNKYTRISIQDYAGGINDSVKDKLFDPYITTKKEGKGTGIGLYMSKRIIEDSMGGVLSVSNQNGGALFIIALPFKAEKNNVL